MSDYNIVICTTCNEKVKYRYHPDHEDECTSDDPSKIGVVN